MNPQYLFSGPLRPVYAARTLATAAFLLVGSSFSWAAETPPAPGTNAPPLGPEKPASAETGETVVLSPFEVVSDTRGYYAANTMSGTRFNSKLEDLASSLTVVTKEQMEDFAMLDINDIFLYTASTEGTGTYTDFEIDRNGQVSDNVQGNPMQANRVRGIASANISLGNFETMGRVPVDPLAVEGVEVSRGPNANVFGLGNPSGTLNMVPASANLSRDRSQAVLRADSYDGYRASLDLNRVLLKNKLAVRVSGSFQHDGFVRKPSGTDTVRYNGMVKAQPFKQTTIRAGFSYYRMAGNRPNYTPPRDYVSYWLASGRPGWDPIAEVVHVNGQTLGPFTTDANLPDYMSRNSFVTGRNNVYVDQGRIAYWTNPSTNATTPLAGTQSVRSMVSAAGSGVNAGRFTAQPLFSTTPSVSSKAMYDWSSINLSAINRIKDQTETYSVQVDQLFLNTPRHVLAGQFGFLREDSESYQKTPLGSSGVSSQTGQLFVDVNERRLDGTPNPFFGRLYVGGNEPRTRRSPTLWDTSRGQLAYKLDLSRENGWLKWLGMHQLTGYDEYKYRISRNYSFRDMLASDHAWIPAGLARANTSSAAGKPAPSPNAMRPYFRYYVGDSQGANVDYAPTKYPYGPTTFTWGSYTIAGGLPVAGTGNFRNEPALMGEVATTDSAGGTSNTKQIIKTKGGVLQSHFLRSKIVSTFGLREDESYSKFGSGPQLLNADGMTLNYDSLEHWEAGDYRFNSGRTKTAGVVVRPFRDMAVINRRAEAGTGVVGFLADAARGLSLTYNRSDSFRPDSPAQDIFLRTLPNPTGTGKDYGFWINALDGRLVLRVNRYENKQVNSRNGDANTLVQRITRLDVFSTDAHQLEANATAWVTADPTHANWTQQQIQAEVSRQMGLTPEIRGELADPDKPLAATNDVVAKGTEIELNFNPNRYWTIAGSVTETKSMNSNVSRALDEWIKLRMPIWTTIEDPRFPDPARPGRGQLWWTRAYGGTSPATYFANSVESPYLIIKETEGKPRSQIRRYAARVSTSYQLAGLTEQRILKRMRIGGALRWEDKGSIGYYGRQQLPAIVTSLDPNKPIWDKAHFYADAFVSYRTKLFADKIGANFQFNVRNLQEGGRLQPIAAFPDGTPSAYRIVDPRQFILQVTLDL